jgi:hypothetical protein
MVGTDSHLRRIQWAKDFQTTDMCIFSIHVICDNEDSEMIAWYWWSSHQLASEKGWVNIPFFYFLSISRIYIIRS